MRDRYLPERESPTEKKLVISSPPTPINIEEERRVIALKQAVKACGETARHPQGFNLIISTAQKFENYLRGDQDEEVKSPDS